ncbi:glycosyltransferase family 4 protein [Iningainema tapete]|uniref:Glycosyltransferase family 4 protein n=1 Tax=Iningainema tapete BLCC-T55 TaxID=2748662 RepID=A0A8J6XIV7_9CYAN|nr:glycosyltransferase family 4 protein [Iningainema tapete]MBD2773231.1 glycosyltransferase family 4 protein [Iningainema tapete BLCC-T55]
MRLTLVIPSMTSGGAERSMSIMANYWAAKGRKITLLTLDDGSESPFYNLEPSIKHIPLGIAANSANILIAIQNNWQRIQVLRSAIIKSQPDTVISSLPSTNVLTLLATRGLNIPVVVNEQNYPLLDNTGIWRKICQLIYPQANRVVFITERALNCFPPKIKSISTVIPNPAVIVSNENSSVKLLDKPSLISIGRLTSQKGFDILLKAFAKLEKAHPQWTLTILGEGELRPDLEALRNQLGLLERVNFIGRVKNPYDFLKQADIFVMSSRYEGFPLALCEAMACGLPVISTDCPSGPAEIICEGMNGILVPNEDVSALAVAMDRLISDPAERANLAARAPEVIERFSLEKIMGMWEKLIKEVNTNCIS